MPINNLYTLVSHQYNANMQYNTNIKPVNRAEDYVSSKYMIPKKNSTPIFRPKINYFEMYQKHDFSSRSDRLY